MAVRRRRDAGVYALIERERQTPRVWRLPSPPLRCPALLARIARQHSAHALRYRQCLRADFACVVLPLAPSRCYARLRRRAKAASTSRYLRRGGRLSICYFRRYMGSRLATTFLLKPIYTYHVHTLAATCWRCALARKDAARHLRRRRAGTFMAVPAPAYAYSANGKATLYAPRCARNGGGNDAVARRARSSDSGVVLRLRQYRVSALCSIKRRANRGTLRRMFDDTTRWRNAVARTRRAAS